MPANLRTKNITSKNQPTGPISDVEDSVHSTSLDEGPKIASQSALPCSKAKMIKTNAIVDADTNTSSNTQAKQRSSQPNDTSLNDTNQDRDHDKTTDRTSEDVDMRDQDDDINSAIADAPATSTATKSAAAINEKKLLLDSAVDAANAAVATATAITALANISMLESSLSRNTASIIASRNGNTPSTAHRNAKDVKSLILPPLSTTPPSPSSSLLRPLPPSPSSSPSSPLPSLLEPVPPSSFSSAPTSIHVTPSNTNLLFDTKALAVINATTNAAISAIPETASSLRHQRFAGKINAPRDNLPRLLEIHNRGTPSKMVRKSETRNYKPYQHCFLNTTSDFTRDLRWIKLRSVGCTSSKFDRAAEASRAIQEERDYQLDSIRRSTLPNLDKTKLFSQCRASYQRTLRESSRNVRKEAFDYVADLMGQISTTLSYVTDQRTQNQWTACVGDIITSLEKFRDLALASASASQVHPAASFSSTQEPYLTVMPAQPPTFETEP